MKKLFLILTLIALALININAQERKGKFKYFFKSRPIFIDSIKTSEGIIKLANLDPIWEFKPTVQVPNLKITESTRENILLDASLIGSIGGGITLQRSIIKNERNYATFSWTPIMLLITGDRTKDEPLDLSYCTTVGFFNNLLQVGVGYDFGTVEDRSRFFLVTSLGINITNN